MRILQISHNHHIVGGSDAVYLATTQLLEAAGHTVIPFCMASGRNRPHPLDSHFPRGADTKKPKLRDLPSYFWNAEAARKLSRLLDAAGPVDVAHLHIYHGKHTPAILGVLKRRGIPVVHSLHEYKLACPVYTMLRAGQPCTRCVGRSPLGAVLHRCKGGSLAHSAVMAAEFAVSRLLGDIRMVDRFICVSEFQRKVMLAAGLPSGKLVTLHNFVDRQEGIAMPPNGGYLLFQGRLERSKGVHTLIEAASRRSVRLVIAGDGPLRQEVERAAAANPLIEYRGFLEAGALHQAIAEARAVVVPSEWYENCPMALLEAKAAGRPVVAARIGGIPELVRPGKDGFLFEAGNVDDLERALAALDAADLGQLSSSAAKDVQVRFSPERHLDRLLAIYAAVRAAPETCAAKRATA